MCSHCFLGTHILDIFVFFFLAVLRSMLDLSLPTKDQTRAPCTGSVEPHPLDRQRSLLTYIFKSRGNI